MHMFRAVRYSGDVGFLREAAYDFMKGAMNVYLAMLEETPDGAAGLLEAGRPIRDEILSVRIARAKQLLAESDKSIETVFVQCGYRDARSLRYVFMKATGLSPLAYRKQIRRERKASGAKAQPPA